MSSNDNNPWPHGTFSDHGHGPAPTNDELGLSRRVVEHETQYHRTTQQTRESLRAQRVQATEVWEPIERMIRGTVGEDVVVDASCPCPPVSWTWNWLRK